MDKFIDKNEVDMKKRTIARSMFYNAKPDIFYKAKMLRNNMTKEESLLWSRLCNSQLGVRFKPQHPIDKFIVDFYCHSSKLAIEIDGENHAYQKEYDQGRDAEIEKFGIKILRFSNADVNNNIEQVIRNICVKLNLSNINNI